MEKTCNRCKKSKNIEEFKKNNNILKQCSLCRQKNVDRNNNKNNLKKQEWNRNWKDKNKERTKDYNKYYRDIRNGIPTKTWEEICIEKGYDNKCKGYPSNHRKLHVINNNITGKHCSSCKEWKSLENYNNSTTNWDGLRTTCKTCLHNYRISDICKENRNKWYKNEMETNIHFKIRERCKTRLHGALKNKNIKKYNKTLDLIGCDIDYLKNYLEKQFTPEMNWANYGPYFHIDHIIPCNAWDLTNELELKACFHYTNLQPLVGPENQSKGDKYCEEEKKIHFDKVKNLILNIN